VTGRRDSLLALRRLSLLVVACVVMLAAVVALRADAHTGDNRAEYVSRAGQKSSVALRGDGGGTVTMDQLARGRPSAGPSDAPVTIVEFTDYACEYCARHATTVLPRLLATYGSRLRYVVRNFPLTESHPQAQQMAQAAECANDQGRFWDLHDALLAHPERLQNDDVRARAKALGLNVDVFGRCLTSGRHYATVLVDAQTAENLGVTGTPAFVVNGVLVVGAKSFEQFARLIDDALARAPRP
jgi:protein-disulfide isomerase